MQQNPMSKPAGRRIEGTIHLAGGSIISLVTLGLLPLLWFTGASAAAYLAVALILAVTLGWTVAGVACIAGVRSASWVARGFLVVVIGLFVWAAAT